MQGDIPYTIKVSKRARKVRLNVTRDAGLVVTIPEYFDRRRVPGIVHEKEAWIRAALDEITRLPAGPVETLPERLDLAAIRESWMIVYKSEATRRLGLRATSAGKVIVISGPVHDKAAVHRLLKRWLKGKAGDYLPGRLEHLSRVTGLPYHNLSIRDQKTRWGSCSALKNINLNLKLLLLPSTLVDYVIIHELCHTREMSHSATFWNLVAGYQPDYKKSRLELRRLSRNLPV